MSMYSLGRLVFDVLSLDVLSHSLLASSWSRDYHYHQYHVIMCRTTDFEFLSSDLSLGAFFLFCLSVVCP